MFTLLWKWLVSLFTVDKIGVLVRGILIKAGTDVGKEILDIDNQKKAYEFVKELNQRKDLTGKEKAKLFNQKMLEWAKKLGKKLAESSLNCLRELAVSTIKAEFSKEEEIKKP